jgi:hypothetical protein
MQYGQLHRRHHRRPQSTIWQERRSLPGPALGPPEPLPPPNVTPPASRSRYRVVRVNGEWVVQMRQDNED